ncbi:uncharacterized protein Dwil_GK27669 [Drosophila willistoni]|uniref:Uncharacterized protein n=1 Tax=Drosophila willistoni TaxID=7260 RepID=A0A0Q9WXE0_DROWI|nr:uncharacterized protein Dwil_GK27669 [Drosophila willistoni]
MSTNASRQSSTFNMYRILRRNNCKTSNYYEGETYPTIRPPLSVCDPSLITKWLSDPQNLEGCPRLFNMRRDNVLEVWNQSPDKHTLSFYGVSSYSHNREADLFNKVLIKSLNQANGKKVQSRKKNPNDVLVPKGLLKCGDNPKHYILNRQALKAEILRMPTVRRKLDPLATLNSIDCYKLACTKFQFTSKVPIKKRKRSLRKKYRYCDQSEKCDISGNKCTEYEWSQYKENPCPYDEAFKQLQQQQLQEEEEVQEEPKDYEELYSRLICCFNENPEGNEIVSLYEKCCKPHPSSDDDGIGAEPVKSGQKLTSNKRPDSKPSRISENKTSVGDQFTDKSREPANKLDYKSSDRKVDRPSSKTDKMLQKPGQKKDDNADNRNVEKPSDIPSDKTEQKSGEKPGQKADEKPGQKAGEKTGQKAGEKPGQKAGEKPGQKIEEKTIEGQKAGEKPGQKIEEKTSETTEKTDKKHVKKTEKIKHISEESVKHEPQRKLEEKKADDKTSGKPKEKEAKDDIPGKPEDHIKKPTKTEEIGAKKDQNAGAKADKKISISGKDKESSQGEHKNKRDSMTEFVRRVLPKEADEPMTENQSSIPTDAFDVELPSEQNPAEKVDSKSSSRKKEKKNLEKLKNEPARTQDDEMQKTEGETNLVNSGRTTSSRFETPKIGTPSKYQKDIDSLELKTSSLLTIQKPNRRLKRRLRKPKKKPTLLVPTVEPAAVVQKVCPCDICIFMKRRCREPDTPLIREMKRRDKERQVREYMRKRCHREYMKRRQVATLGAPPHKCDPILCDDFVYNNTQLSKYCESLEAMQKLQAVLKRIQKWTGNPLHSHLNDLRIRIVLRICDCMENDYKETVETV